MTGRSLIVLSSGVNSACWGALLWWLGVTSLTLMAAMGVAFVVPLWLLSFVKLAGDE